MARHSETAPTRPGPRHARGRRGGPPPPLQGKPAGYGVPGLGWLGKGAHWIPKEVLIGRPALGAHPILGRRCVPGIAPRTYLILKVCIGNR